MTVHPHGKFIVLSLSYPIKTERQARKQEVSILYVIGLTRPGTEFQISRMQSPRSTDWITVPCPKKHVRPIMYLAYMTIEGVTELVGALVGCPHRRLWVQNQTESNQ